MHSFCVLINWLNQRVTPKSDQMWLAQLELILFLCCESTGNSHCYYLLMWCNFIEVNPLIVTDHVSAVHIVNFRVSYFILGVSVPLVSVLVVSVFCQILSRSSGVREQHSSQVISWDFLIASASRQRLRLISDHDSYFTALTN